MSNTLEDLLVVLLESREIRGEDIGLGKNEIHPVAHKLKRETSELFQEATFRSGYRGIRSPDIRRALSYFEYGVDCEVKEEDEDEVEHSDEYYYLSKQEDIQTAEDRLNELDEDTIESIQEVLQELDDDWLRFVRGENDEMTDAIEADLAD